MVSHGSTINAVVAIGVSKHVELNARHHQLVHIFHLILVVDVIIGTAMDQEQASF